MTVMSTERSLVKREKSRRTKVQPTSSDNKSYPLSSKPQDIKLKSGFPQSHLLPCWLFQKPSLHNLCFILTTISPPAVLWQVVLTQVWATLHFYLMAWAHWMQNWWEALCHKTSPSSSPVPSANTIMTGTSRTQINLSITFKTCFLLEVPHCNKWKQLLRIKNRSWPFNVVIHLAYCQFLIKYHLQIKAQNFLPREF